MALLEAICFPVPTHGYKAGHNFAGERRRNRDGARRAVSIVSRDNGAGQRSRADQLSGKEFFESFLRRQQADGDFVSKAAAVLWRREVIELDEESRLRVQEKLSRLEKMREVQDNGSFFKLSQARNWSLGQDEAPRNSSNATLEREKMRDDRKKQSLLEYEALKRELSLMTAAIAIGVSAYCFIILSPEATLSYGTGALASLGYLQLLYRHVDEISEENVADIFVQRKIKRIGITSTSIEESIEKIIRGSARALSSPRLVIPTALYGLWMLSYRFADTIPVRLEVAPLLCGFFAYKAAALLQAYRDNKDLLFTDPRGPKDPGV